MQQQITDLEKHIRAQTEKARQAALLLQQREKQLEDAKLREQQLAADLSLQEQHAEGLNAKLTETAA